MNNIDALLAQLCPNGVEFRDLGEVMSITRGASPRPILNYLTNDPDGISWIKIGDVNSKYKYITKTKERITKEGAEKSRYLKKGDFVLSNSMSFGRPYILAIDGCIHDGWISMQNFESVLISDFLYHLFRSDIVQNYWKQKASSGTVQNLNADIVRATKIPIPPLPIQQEIANILDKFTQFEAELQAELQARRAQYEYYRNELLDFEGKEVEWKTLGDICVIGDGLHGTPVYNNSGNYYFINGNNLTNGKIVFDDKTKKVDDSSYKKYGIAFSVENSVFMSINGTIGSVALFNNENIVLGKSVAYFNVKSNCLYSKYLFYLLQTDNARDYYERQKTGSTIKNLGLKSLREFKIPIPPLAEQNRIVAILDKFDKLVNDISEGLPAEIVARRKQYEYYRGKLLTFKCLNR